MLNKLFKLDENNTNVKTEVIAGLTTFMAMAYILAVNPNILSSTGMNRDAVLLATSIASFIGCIDVYKRQRQNLEQMSLQKKSRNRYGLCL